MVLTVSEKVPWGVTDCWQRRCPRLRGPELGPVIQRMDQLGCQLDVIAHDLLVLGNAIDVADSTGQVSVHTRAQLTFPELEGTKSLPTLAPRSSNSKTGPTNKICIQTELTDKRDQRSHSQEQHQRPAQSPQYMLNASRLNRGNGVQ